MTGQRITVIPCTCPRCGGNLAGLDADRVFFCAPCRIGVAPDVRATRTWPVRRVAVREESPGQLIHLPVWMFRIDTTFHADSSKQLARIGDPGLHRVFVPAYTMHGQATHGNIGIQFTREQPEIPMIDDACFLSGCRKTAGSAEKLVETILLSIIDRKVDVTGLTIDIAVRKTELLAIPFFLENDMLRDGITGGKYPARAFDDLQGYLQAMNSAQHF